MIRRKKAFRMMMGLLVLGVSEVRAVETFEYPELNVTPRASERIETEARLEKEHRFTSHLAIQASALSTFLAGVFQGSDVDLARDPDKKTPIAGMVVGGAWLAVTAALSFYDTPYSDVAHDLEGIPKRTVREQLTRERMAEEAIRNRSRIGLTMKWLSVATHFSASVYMLSNAASGSFGKVADGFSMVMAFTPLIFRNHWQEVAEEQADYKKRIYAPVASAGLIGRTDDGKVVPGIQLSFHF